MAKTTVTILNKMKKILLSQSLLGLKIVAYVIINFNTHINFAYELINSLIAFWIETVHTLHLL